MSRSPFHILAALLLASCSQTGDPAIAVEDAWARATLPAQASSAVYFTIRNTGGADRLLSVSSTAATASLHSASMDNGVMRMRPLESLDIPANSTVELKPGGAHVMLTDVAQPLTDGMTVPLDLSFERAGERHVVATVRSANGAAM
jgi:copper(I)-binding protein